ncbi:hypothetical protein K474DRAFT_1673746, partial [Panus rudis PR-1116 ss-1]
MMQNQQIPTTSDGTSSPSLGITPSQTPTQNPAAGSDSATFMANPFAGIPPAAAMNPAAYQYYAAALNAQVPGMMNHFGHPSHSGFPMFVQQPQAMNLLTALGPSDGMG